MQPDDPDPDGEQLKAPKGFLNSPGGKKIERVWIDSACMPQDLPKGSRSAEDTVAFKGMLKEVNRLYLGTTVLILLDLSYVSRFWTQFESWLAMQFAMPDGLKPAVGTKNERHHVVASRMLLRRLRRSRSCSSTSGRKRRLTRRTPSSRSPTSP